MGRAGGKALLDEERLLQPPQHPVEGSGEGQHLPLGARFWDTPIQVPAIDSPCGRRQVFERTQHLPRGQIGGTHGQQRYQRHGQKGLGGKLLGCLPIEFNRGGQRVVRPRALLPGGIHLHQTGLEQRGIVPVIGACGEQGVGGQQ